MPSSIRTMPRFSATSLPELASIEYQPLRSRPLSSEIQPPVPDDGRDGAPACARLVCAARDGTATAAAPTLRKLLRFTSVIYLLRFADLLSVVFAMATTSLEALICRFAIMQVSVIEEIVGKSILTGSTSGKSQDSNSVRTVQLILPNQERQ